MTDRDYSVEDQRIYEMKRQRMERVARNIADDIATRGISVVLAEIVEDPSMYQNRMNR